jgi:lipopolysaccharide/colanic/teichoic acid biosynthesis glycosyltransferase
MIDVKARPQILLRKQMEAVSELPYVMAVEESFLYAMTKRLLDVTIAFVALVLFSPLLALVALVIRLDSSGPALFKQRRVGRWGKEFIVYKFRTMYYKADEVIHREFAKKYIRGQGEKDEQGCFKPKNDSRITRIGRILRQTSLDELPQLINVLKGDMSLVGPRPAVRYEVEEYERWQMRRLAVLPGMTGLAQISGRSGLTFEKIIRLDIEYIEKRSVFADLKIALLTLPMLILARCAG